MARAPSQAPARVLIPVSSGPLSIIIKDAHPLIERLPDANSALATLFEKRRPGLVRRAELVTLR